MSEALKVTAVADGIDPQTFLTLVNYGVALALSLDDKHFTSLKGFKGKTLPTFLDVLDAIKFGSLDGGQDLAVFFALKNSKK